MPFDVRHLWADPSMFATSLVALFIDEYGTEGFEWHPVTIQMELEELGVNVPTVNYDKLMTGIGLLTTDNFFHSLPDFVRICVVLSGHEPTSNELMLPDSAELAWGITEALLINPPDDNVGNPFGPEITGFIGMVLDNEGILNPPDILRIATRDQTLVDRVNYDFSEDTELFGAIHQEEASKTNDINHVVRGRMKGLVKQLQALPLKNGSFAQAATKMLANLPGDEDMPMPV